MPIDDENNPQREAVLARERSKIEHDVWLQMRIEAVLADAATIAALPGIVLTADGFTRLALAAFHAARERHEKVVKQEVARREWALALPTHDIASPTTPTNEETKP